ncbi:MAG: Acg family FMN-binding oxidoreductase [Acidobacteriaceae bacterium]
MDRRDLLKGTGAVAILVAGGGVWYAYEEGAFSAGKGPAFQPWKNWNEAKTGPLALVRAAILSASPHNTQPWLFRVDTAKVELYADTSRNTGALDPFLRELHIGLGCALENMMVTASVIGYRASADLVPGSLDPPSTKTSPQLVATVEIGPSTGEPVRLIHSYEAIPHRHTNRTDYTMQELPSDFLAALREFPGPLGNTKMFLFTGAEDRHSIVDLVSQSNRVVYANRKVDASTLPWERFSWKAVERQRDGITPEDYGVPPLQAAIFMCLPKPAQMAILARAARDPKDDYAKQLAASPMFGIIAVRERYDRQQCLQAGRVWEYSHLLATSRGIAARPINEAVELVDIERVQQQEPVAATHLAQLTGDIAWQPTFMFRMGYALRPAALSPRRDVSQVLLS